MPLCYPAPLGARPLGSSSAAVGTLAGVNPRTAWIVYSFARLAFFAAPFAALMLIGWPWWLAAVVSTLAAVSLSIIFLSKPREAASAGVYEWRHRNRTADDIAEDAALDGVSSDGAASDHETAPREAP